MTAPFNWPLLTFNQLDKSQLYAILKIRSEIFVAEQKSPYQDIDGLDPACHHLIGQNTPDSIAAYLRIVPPTHVGPEPRIGRVLIAPPYRQTGLGRALCQQGIQMTKNLYPQQDIFISAQCYLEKFYSSFGFETRSTPYDEDGVMHIDMLLPYKD